MVYLETESDNAAFHFSVEEYIVQHYPFNEPVMMFWQSDKCAMLGCNQIAEAEIDVRYAENKEIQIVRRLSGGGTIFTDSGTLLYTMILPQSKEQYPQEIAKTSVAGPIAESLNKMGIPASVEGRNDILVDGKKVSGFAQYVRHGRICTHGSLLYDTDLEMLARVLRTDEEKIRTKALKSVRSRVTNIKEYMDHPYTIREFWGLLKQELFFGRNIRERSLSEFDLAQIDNIFRVKYGNSSWTFNQTPKFSFHNKKRFPGGGLEVYLDIIKGAVSSCSIRGDFLGVMPIHDLEKLFENNLFHYQTICKVLEGIPIEPFLGNITKDEFLSCMFE